MSPAELTRVDLVWIERQVEQWIRSGRVVAEQVIDRRRRQVAFAPGSVFALVRWAASEGETAQSRLDILRAAYPGETISTVPGVDPGGVLLLRTSGWPKVRRALVAIDAVEALGVDPADAAPDHWRHVHNRLTARGRPRPYCWRRHQAWRMRKALGA